jgi:hypothetical protein
MVADGLIKPLPPVNHTHFVQLLELEYILETLQTAEAADVGLQRPL